MPEPSAASRVVDAEPLGHGRGGKEVELFWVDSSRGHIDSVNEPCDRVSAEFPPRCQPDCTTPTLTAMAISATTTGAAYVTTTGTRR